MNKIKSLCFPVKGVGGFNLIVSEVVFVMVSVFLAIVSVVVCCLSGCQSFVLGVKVSGIVEFKVLWCQGVRVCL
jgi:hypothetical protein